MLSSISMANRVPQLASGQTKQPAPSFHGIHKINVHLKAPDAFLRPFITPQPLDDTQSEVIARSVAAHILETGTQRQINNAYVIPHEGDLYLFTDDQKTQAPQKGPDAQDLLERLDQTQNTTPTLDPMSPAKIRGYLAEHEDRIQTLPLEITPGITLDEEDSSKSSLRQKFLYSTQGAPDKAHRATGTYWGDVIHGSRGLSPIEMVLKLLTQAAQESGAPMFEDHPNHQKWEPFAQQVDTFA